MTRNHRMLLGFFLIIAGLFLFAVVPRIGTALVWVGVTLAWLGMAVALENKAWPSVARRLLQILIGAAAVAIAMSATRLPLIGVLLATMIGSIIGAFASQWSAWLLSNRK